MWKKWHRVLCVIVFFFLGACAQYWPPPDKGMTSVTPVVKPGGPSDAELFHEGMSYLDGTISGMEYDKAKASFTRLVHMYPESKWRNLAVVLIRIIDDVITCRHANESEDSMSEKTKPEMEKLQKENEQLKKNNRILLERLSAETARLTQENEQLKKDIERLKNLEVQLERREKLLR